MSYLVLARKYRPKSFSEMVGQDHVVRALSNALESGRLHHAYLFTGTRGVGKTTVSRILAKSLNCIGVDGTGGVTSQPCGVCQACRDIDAGHFVDYTELDAASNRGVEDVQALLDQAAYKPVQGRYKVFMIDEVHMLSNTAFNAMLKTLEEPPEFLKFVLATTDPQKVPVTVLSRCLQFALRPMAPETITAHLLGVLKEEQIVHDIGSLQLLAQSARGSMRDALSLTDQAIAYGAGVLQEAGVRTMLGAVDKSHAMAILQALLDADGLALVQLVAVLRENGLAATMVLDELSAWLQRIAVLQVGARLDSKSNSVDAAQTDSGQNTDEAQMLAFAAGFAKDEVQLLYSICLQGKQDLGWASDEYSALTMVLLRYLAFLPEGAGDGEKKKPEPVAKLNVVVDANLYPGADADAASSEPTQAQSPAIPLSQPTSSPAIEDTVSAEVVETAVVKPLLALPVRSMAVNELGDGALDARIQHEPPSAEHEKWQALVAQWVESGTVTAMASQLAVQSQCMSWTDSHIILRVEQNTLNNEAAKQKLWDALQEAGHHVVLLVQLGPVASSYAIAQTARKEALQQIATDYVMQSPLVSMLLEDFDGKIIPGSIEVLNSDGFDTPSRLKQ